MAKREQRRIDESSDWYLKDQLDFDKRLIRYGYLTFKPFFLGSEGLELGPAEGQMTQFLVRDFKKLTVVDASKKLLDQIEDRSNLIKVHSLFEKFKPNRRFNTIILNRVLEHVQSPVQMLLQAKKWLSLRGRIILGVPNANSIHRLAAVKMGLLKKPWQLNERDKILGHRRVYTVSTFSRDIRRSGLKVEKLGGIFFKPLSNQQIENFWSQEMMDGFYALGKDFPEYAAELYAVCRNP